MSELRTISPEQVKENLTKGDPTPIIDVREDEEVAAGMIPGAIHIRLAEIPDRLAEIPQNRDVIVVCRSGKRSERACEFLLQQGYQPINMVGGMMAWEQL